MKGWMYILKCVDDSYYTGSTKNLELRLAQHQNGEGANYTAKRLPVELVYFEEFNRIDKAFYREKQVQGWSRKKKEALINGMPENLHELAKCLNETSHVGFDSAQPTDITPVVERSGINPVVERSGINPVVERSGINPVVERSGINPVVERSGINLVVERSRNDLLKIKINE